MNKLLLLVLCLTCGINAAAQEAAQGQTPPGVSVVALKWVRAISRPGIYEPQPYDASRSNTTGTLPDQSQPPRPVPPNPFPPSGRLPYFYTYSLTIKDAGRKHIKAIEWEHIFAERDGGQELARHVFVSREKKGGAGGAAIFKATSASPPSQVVTAGGLATDERSPFAERAEIRCVLYEDGTFWERPGAQGGGCEGLRRWKAWKESRRRRS